MKLESELCVTATSMGRFGTSISSLTDLNGDGLRDIAVGAPLEDDNRGVVYIYLGDGQKGIRSTFSQVGQNKTHFCFGGFLCFFGGGRQCCIISGKIIETFVSWALILSN